MPKKLSTEEFKEYVYKECGDDYTVIGKYKNAKTKIRIRHNVCSCKDGFFEYDTTPHAFKTGVDVHMSLISLSME